MCKNFTQKQAPLSEVEIRLQRHIGLSAAARPVETALETNCCLDSLD
jgi:hypothetical protein